MERADEYLLDQNLNTMDEEQLKALRHFLFEERIALINERRAQEEFYEKFMDERISFREEMKQLNSKVLQERKRLKDEQAFFDKKLAILQNGFASLEMDRKAFQAADKRVAVRRAELVGGHRRVQCQHRQDQFGQAAWQEALHQGPHRLLTSVPDVPDDPLMQLFFAEPRLQVDPDSQIGRKRENQVAAELDRQRPGDTVMGKHQFAQVPVEGPFPDHGCQRHILQG